MQLFDTHCHIHFHDYPLDPETVIASATQAGVSRLLCVGCRLEDSRTGVDFAAKYSNIWAAIGLHPHEADGYVHDHHALQEFRDLADKPKVVAIGETGLDYYYSHSAKPAQEKLLRFQIELALEHDLPMVFHVRDAFDAFWKIFDDYKDIRGVVHSFSATEKELDQILSRNLYVGLNGIMTFTKDPRQLDAAKRVPLDKMLLETDAPFLTPAPFRGKVCEPKHLRVTAEFLASTRGEKLEDVAKVTTQNAKKLFGV